MLIYFTFHVTIKKQARNTMKNILNAHNLNVIQPKTFQLDNWSNRDLIRKEFQKIV